MKRVSTDAVQRLWTEIKLRRMEIIHYPFSIFATPVSHHKEPANKKSHEPRFVTFFPDYSFCLNETIFLTL